MAATHIKRDTLFLFLSGIFLTALVLGNVIGTTKFVTIFTLELPSWLQAITPELVKKYLGSVIPITDHYFATLNPAVFTDGSFVYIPPNTRCPM